MIEAVCEPGDVTAQLHLARLEDTVVDAKTSDGASVLVVVLLQTLTAD